VHKGCLADARKRQVGIPVPHTKQSHDHHLRYYCTPLGQPPNAAPDVEAIRLTHIILVSCKPRQARMDGYYGTGSSQALLESPAVHGRTHARCKLTLSTPMSYTSLASRAPAVLSLPPAKLHITLL